MKDFNQSQKPLYDCVEKYVANNPTRFHMPSHKGEAFCGLYKSAKYDITELDFSDNLIYPNGVIKEAEELLADFYGVDNAFMCTSGATTGLFVSLFVAKSKGKKILLSRNSHKSIYNAISVLGLEPVFLDVEYDEYGFPLPLSVDLIKNGIAQNKDVSTVLVTSPDYFGRVADLEEIAKICQDKLLICDGAHGAHFAFCDDLTLRGELFADICVLSMHKTLPCFTGSAVVLCKNEYIDKVKKGREIFHTSSPYYPAMASMDYARYEVSSQKYYQGFKEFIEELGFDKIPTYDYCKLLLKGGEELDKRLKEQGIFCECIFGDYLLFILTPWDKQKISVLKNAVSSFKKSEKNIKQVKKESFTPRRITPFSEVSAKDGEYVPLEKCVNRILASEIGLYPPGVPIFIRGEVVDEKGLEFLIENKKYLFGVDSGRVYVVK